MDCDNLPSGFVSALDFHTLRSAFQKSVSELAIPEGQWADHEQAMVRQLTDIVDVDADLINLIIRK